MIRLLLAEDQAMVRGALSALLGMEPDIEVVGAAADGESAWRELQRHTPDVLVTAVQRVLAGRRYISPALAEHLADALAGETNAASHETLSNRELLVLRLIASGKTIKEISSDLSLSVKTVATYRSRIAEKMGLSTNVELTRYAMQHGLVE